MRGGDSGNEGRDSRVIERGEVWEMREWEKQGKKEKIRKGEVGEIKDGLGEMRGRKVVEVRGNYGWGSTRKLVVGKYGKEEEMKGNGSRGKDQK